VRAILTFDVTENFDYMLKYEHSTFNITGRSIEIVDDEPATSRLPGITGRTWGEILANTNITIPKGAAGGGLPTNTATLALNAGPSVLNNSLNHERSSNGDTSDNTTDNATFVGNYAIDKSVLTFTTAWLSYHYDENCDCDFTGSNIFTLESKEKYDQFSQEVRFLSPVDEELEYITGIYYQTSDLKFNDDFVVPPGSALPALVNYAAKFNATAVDDNSGFALANISVPRSYTQDSDLYSAFGEVTWNIQTDFRAIFGGRYSYEKKDATRELTVGSNGIVPVQVTQAVLSKLFKVDTVGHDLKDNRSKGNFSPEVKVEYDINDDSLAYAKATEGYKSGGYDTRSNAIPGGINDGSFEFDDERATAYEVGMKNSLFNDEVELNVAYFYTEYDDMQVSIYDGKLGFNVGNAAKAVSQGVEVESRWQATEQLSFSGSLAYLDFEYKDFQNGQCPQGVTPDNAATGYCSYDGKSNQYVAPWTAAVLSQFVQPLFDGMELKFNLDLLYSDDYNPTQNLDPRVEQDAYTKVNARIGLSGNDGQWDIALVGKNLTNEEIITYANDTPLSYNLVQSVGHYAVVEDLRTVAITATYRF
jgi:iron complex outermembrane receptor protein